MDAHILTSPPQPGLLIGAKISRYQRLVGDRSYTVEEGTLTLSLWKRRFITRRLTGVGVGPAGEAGHLGGEGGVPFGREFRVLSGYARG